MIETLKYLGEKISNTYTNIILKQKVKRQGTTISNQVLNNQKLTLLTISDVNFEHCQFNKCDFSQLLLLNCTFINCRFNGCDLCSTVFTNCNTKALFDECKMKYVIIKNSQFSGTKFLDTKLFSCKLKDSNMENCCFCDVDMSCSTIQKENFTSAYFNKATLAHADIYETELTDAHFDDVSLVCTHLTKCDFTKAQLVKTNFTSAQIKHCNFDGAESDEETTNLQLNCPEEGSFVGWKKASNLQDHTALLVKLLIPSDAKRSSATTRKCRASMAQVIDITDLQEKTHYKQAHSIRSTFFTYTIGETMYADSFDDNRWNECANGIHFFITKQEAIQY